MGIDNVTSDYSMYYVYNPVGTEDLKKVRIVMNITNDDILLYIISDEEVSPENILNILNLVHENTMKKIRINVYADCRIFYEFDGKTYQVNLKGTNGNEASSESASCEIEVVPVQ